MNSGNGLVGPETYPIRRPTDTKQTNGRVVNPVRMMELGGFTGTGKWPKGNDMRVEKPTGISKGKRESTGQQGV